MAARFANAPSYSQLQVEETRVAVRAAEIATKVALEAQAAAETALAEMHAATQEPLRGPGVVHPITSVRPAEIDTLASPQKASPAAAVSHAQAAAMQDSDVSAPAAEPEPQGRRFFGIRWDPDMPVRHAETRPAARRVPEEFEIPVEDWWSPGESTETLRNNPIEVGEAELHANLIQFPRELVATRKMRPRRAEGAAGSETDEEGQLSIFEVDPAMVRRKREHPRSRAVPVPSGAVRIGPA